MYIFRKVNVSFPTLLVLFATVFALLFFFPSVISGEYLRGYDALTHIFFSNGYFQEWWNSWDLRWYGGYSRFTYPPLSHQLVALLTFLTNNLELSYQLISWGLIGIFPFSMFIFCRNFSDRLSSSVAALLVIFSPSIRSIVFVFGQFAGFTGLVFSLLAAGFWGKYLRVGKKSYLFASVFFSACTVASHHNTAIYFLPGILLSVLLALLFQDEYKQKEVFYRVTIATILITITSFIVILPFWLWMLTLKMQVPIPHPSREDFSHNYLAAKFFVFDLYGPLLIFVPFVLLYAVRSDKVFRLISVFFLFYGILGLGGTTRLPSLIFGQWWAWLTYERFGVWATIFLIALSSKYITQVKNTIPSLSMLLGICLLVFFTLSWIVAPQSYRSTPERVNVATIKKVFGEFDYCRYRFLALDFAYQLPDLSISTNAKTLDGLWHTARSDSFMRQSGIGALSDALQWPNGEEVLRKFLNRSIPISANCILVNESGTHSTEYKKIITESGWQHRKTYDSTVSLWTNKNNVIQQDLDSSSVRENIVLTILWGVMPVGFFAFAIITTIVIIFRDLSFNRG